MSIGLEQVQVQYQAVLDDFISNKITEEEMLEGVQWKTRWTWPYDNYRPIFSSKFIGIKNWADMELRTFLTTEIL